MKINDIEVGKRYTVKIAQDLDNTAWHYGGEVVATAVAAPIKRDVHEYTTWNIKGTPRVRTRTREGDYVDGVEVVWETQGGTDRFTGHKTSDYAIPAGRAVVAAKCVVEPADEVNVGGERLKKDAQERLAFYQKKGYKSAHLLKISGYWCVFISQSDYESYCS